MAEPFIGQIVMFAGNFAPRGWALCDGQLLPISQYSALFSILGTTYGGDGRTTFGLPELRGRAPIHAGTGPGLTPRRLGQRAGEESVTLNATQIPSHTHTLNGAGVAANATNPAGGMLAETREDSYAGAQQVAPMASATVAATGGGQAHNNMPPYTVVNYIIALQGIFPSRS